MNDEKITGIMPNLIKSLETEACPDGMPCNENPLAKGGCYADICHII
jgi:hypothetical protein